MCGKLGVSGRLVVPGTTMQFSIGKNKRIGVWGLPNAMTQGGQQSLIYNARSEKLIKFWKHLCPNRGVVYADYFIENKVHACGYADRHPVGMAVIYNDLSEFLIVTQDACESIAKIHKRMPVIVTDENQDLWIDQGIIQPPLGIVEVARIKIANQLF